MKSNLGQDSGGRQIQVDPVDSCPICHRTGVFGQVALQYDKDHFPDRIQQALKCQSPSCSQFFIATYRQVNNQTWYLASTAPRVHAPRAFDTALEALSPNFVTIYNQALAAEGSRLTEICGPGYRKALEFLVKDYLIGIRPNEAETIKKLQLGACIGQYVSDGNLKTCAKRATWLGNDETHYVRRWEDKDLKDLKTLIDLTVHWVQAEILTKQLEESMPDPSKTTDSSTASA